MQNKTSNNKEECKTESRILVLEAALAVNCLDWLGPVAEGIRRVAFSWARPGRLHTRNRASELKR
jgi:hypothetical protein